jgi:two-component system sensor histidine kinase YesM
MKDDSNHTILANPETSVRELVAYQKSPYTDWTYITVMPEETILKPVQNLFRMLLWVVVLFIAISVAISFYMSLSLTKPIHKLRNIIYKTELDTLGIHNDSSLDTSIDELEELNQAFQNMSTKLKNSMNELIYTRQQEMRSRNMALQSQINPHFYYNSLSSIIILAENGRCEDVVTLCRSLGSIMRYIAKDSENTVTLGEEIDYIKKYLYCMKIRYQSSLNYHINIDESLLDIKIPKLIIQPLVENAIKYGTDCTPPWDIYIKSTVSDDYWRIDVIDSGNGFPDEIIETLNEKINNAKNHIGIPNIEIDGMGLVNVYSRWKLHCGNNIIFTFGNMEKGGGIVSIGRYLKNAINENGPSTLPSDS